MDEALSALDPSSRQTVELLLAVISNLDGKGVGALFESDGQFSGALSAGTFRGRAIIESHCVQVFKRLPRGTVLVGPITVLDRQVVIDWCITIPEEASFTPVPATWTVLLGPSGLVQSLRSEWNPAFLSKPPQS